MTKHNPIQFSVVREDPRVELGLIKTYRVKSAVMVGSGGCTALAIAGAYPTVELTLIEPNAAQIALIQAKIKRMTTGNSSTRPRDFGVGASRGSLIERGNFETLFRQLRELLFEFVIARDEVERLVTDGTTREWRRVFAHPYWPVAFDLFLSNSLLLTMFGPAAIQHAPNESFPGYFRAVFERGLLRRDRPTNYFLHHLLLGHYLETPAAWPDYLLRAPQKVDVDFHQCLAQDFASYAGYDLVGLSNILDWSSDAEVRALAERLNRQLTPGTLIVYRQLNNAKDFRAAFGPNFAWLDAEAARLHRADRSLFYSSLHLGRKQ